MPICQIKTNYIADEALKKEFVGELTASLARILKKPEPAIMIMLSEEYMVMNYKTDTTVFAEFRYIMDFAGAEEKKQFLEAFSDEMLKLFIKYFKVDPHRVYMQFTEMSRDGAWRYIEK